VGNTIVGNTDDDVRFSAAQMAQKPCRAPRSSSSDVSGCGC